eukprot:UN34212
MELFENVFSLAKFAQPLAIKREIPKPLELKSDNENVSISPRADDRRYARGKRKRESSKIPNTIPPLYSPFDDPIPQQISENNENNSTSSSEERCIAQPVLDFSDHQSNPSTVRSRPISPYINCLDPPSLINGNNPKREMDEDQSP